MLNGTCVPYLQHCVLPLLEPGLDVLAFLDRVVSHLIRDPVQHLGYPGVTFAQGKLHRVMHETHRRLQLFLTITVHHHLIYLTHRGPDWLVHNPIIFLAHHANELVSADDPGLPLQRCNCSGEPIHSVELLCDILQPCPYNLHRWSCPIARDLQLRQLNLVMDSLGHHSTESLRLCFRLQRDSSSLCLHRLCQLQHR